MKNFNKNFRYRLSSFLLIAGLFLLYRQIIIKRIFIQNFDESIIQRQYQAAQILYASAPSSLDLQSLKNVCLGMFDYTRVLLLLDLINNLVHYKDFNAITNSEIFSEFLIWIYNKLKIEQVNFDEYIFYTKDARKTAPEKIQKSLQFYKRAIRQGLQRLIDVQDFIEVLRKSQARSMTTDLA